MSITPNAHDHAARDEMLVARLRAGDDDAFRDIWMHYYGRLVESAVRYLQSYDAAADVVQQLFLELWIERRTLTPRTTLESYLYRAVWYRVQRVFKRDRMERHHAVRVAAESAEAVPVTPHLGELAVEAEELDRLARAAVARMTPRVREIFLMHRQDGLRAAQIAEVLGISPQVVYNQLSKALKLLAEACGVA